MWRIRKKERSVFWAQMSSKPHLDLTLINPFPARERKIRGHREGVVSLITRRGIITTISTAFNKMILIISMATPKIGAILRRSITYSSI